MTSTFDYTGYAMKFFYRHPVLRHVGVQIIFWVLANIFLVIFTHLSTAVFIQQQTGPISQVQRDAFKNSHPACYTEW